MISVGDKKVQSTPLLDYLAVRKQDKRGRDERRRRENDKRKMRIERKGKDLPIKVCSYFIFFLVQFWTVNTTIGDK